MKVQGGFLCGQSIRNIPQFTLRSLRYSSKKVLPRNVPPKVASGSEEINHIEDVSNFETLKFWLTANGASLDAHGLKLKLLPSSGQFSQVSTGDAPRGRGLLASRRYQRGELIARIPNSLHFSPEALEQLLDYVVKRGHEECGTGSSQSCKADFERVRDPYIRLALPLALFQVLQEEKGLSPRPVHSKGTQLDGSSIHRLYEGWLAYLRVLTPPPAAMPIFWSAEEVRALGHPIASAVFARRYRLQRIFRDVELTVRNCLNGFLPASRQPSSKTLFEGLVSAYATVLSHAMKISSQAKALVPLVDLCGHSPHGGNASLKLSPASLNPDEGFRPNVRSGGCASQFPVEKKNITEHQSACTESLQLVATSDIPSGEEILVSYGAFDNPTLLLNYGLLPRENP